MDFDTNGNLYLALREGNAVYRIDTKANRVTHIAGNGQKGLAGDNGPAKQAALNGPKGISISPKDGAVYLADTENHAIRRIDVKTGVISTIAGTGERGDGPEPNPKSCRMSRPHGVFVGRDGAVYVGDSEAHRVRVIK
jgi:DNA-binding beta-propeller fold protein YncE